MSVLFIYFLHSIRSRVFALCILAWKSDYKLNFDFSELGSIVFSIASDLWVLFFRVSDKVSKSNLSL